MQEVAKVVAIEQDVVSVIPLDIEVCIGCTNAECKTNGSVFKAVNRKKLDIHVGSEVRIAASVKKQFSQGLFAIGFPSVLAVLSYVLLPRFIPSVQEGVQVAVALLLLLVGFVITYQLSKQRSSDLPEIVSVLPATPQVISDTDAADEAEYATGPDGIPEAGF